MRPTSIATGRPIRPPPSTTSMTPRVASTHAPKEFAADITDMSQPVAMPALAFAELVLDRLGDDPEAKAGRRRRQRLRYKISALRKGLKSLTIRKP